MLIIEEIDSHLQTIRTWNFTLSYNCYRHWTSITKTQSSCKFCRTYDVYAWAVYSLPCGIFSSWLAPSCNGMWTSIYYNVVSLVVSTVTKRYDG